MGTATSWVMCYLGLGSNLVTERGQPIDHLYDAIERLQANPNFCEVASSTFYASAPVGPQDQPDFINAVVRCQTQLAPMDLLAYCQSLEMEAGRKRLRHWGERSLDVDILAYGQMQMQSDTLTLPHPRCHERLFVLLPWLELAPDLYLQGHPVQHWISLIKDQPITRLD